MRLSEERLFLLSIVGIVGIVAIVSLTLSSSSSRGSADESLLGLAAAPGWLCNPAYYGDGDCDCGCGIRDVDCSLSNACTYAGCYDAECKYCFAENTGQSVGCPDGPSPDEPSPDNNGWLCKPAYYGDGDCDCGCGIRDVDCPLSNECTYTGCYDDSCEFCFAENTGGDVTCPSGPPPTPSCNDGIKNGDETGVDCGGSCPSCEDDDAGWLCKPAYYGDGDCDCGCGIRDVDCSLSNACTFTGCYDAECDYCFAENDGQSVGCPDPPPTPSCDDGIKNGDETGVDCGGSCGGDCCANGYHDSNLGETGVDCGGSCPPCEDDDVLFSMDFEHRPLGKYETLAEFKADWKTDDWGGRGDEFEVVRDPDDPSNKVGLFTFPFYDSDDVQWICWGASGCYDGQERHIRFDSIAALPQGYTSKKLLNGVHAASGGGEWYTYLGGKYQELFLSYKVRFEPDFQGSLGGKLFGFYPHYRPCGGGSTDCVGNDGIADDFVAKHMFHDDHISYYLYYYDKVHDYGDSKGVSDSYLYDGDWHTIVLYVRMNDVDVPNGVVRTWIDGVERNSWTGITFRTGDGRLGIQDVGITTFFGGSATARCDTKDGGACGNELPWSSQRETCAVDPDDPCSDVVRYSDGTPFYRYAPRKTEYLWVDDIRVYRP